MNYYRRYVGDYLKKTSKLSLLEHGAYSILLDYYYSEEEPVTADLDEVYRMCRAITPEERRAVVKVLNKFFSRAEDGYHNKRADEEIIFATKARANGAKGGRPRTGSETESETGEVTEDITECQTIEEGEALSGEGGESGHPLALSLKPLTANPLTTKKKTGRKRPCVCLPEGFTASDRVKAWASEKGFTRLDAHLEHFVGWARAGGKAYADWDQAFMNAIRDDWAKVRANGAPVDVDEMVRELEAKNATH